MTLRRYNSKPNGALGKTVSSCPLICYEVPVENNSIITNKNCTPDRITPAKPLHQDNLFNRMNLPFSADTEYRWAYGYKRRPQSDRPWNPKKDKCPSGFQVGNNFIPFEGEKVYSLSFMDWEPQPKACVISKRSAVQRPCNTFHNKNIHKVKYLNDMRWAYGFSYPLPGRLELENTPMERRIGCYCLYPVDEYGQPPISMNRRNGCDRELPPGCILVYSSTPLDEDTIYKLAYKAEDQQQRRFPFVERSKNQSVKYRLPRRLELRNDRSIPSTGCYCLYPVDERGQPSWISTMHPKDYSPKPPRFHSGRRDIEMDPSGRSIGKLHQCCNDLYPMAEHNESRVHPEEYSQHLPPGSILVYSPTPLDEDTIYELPFKPADRQRRRVSTERNRYERIGGELVRKGPSSGRYRQPGWPKLEDGAPGRCFDCYHLYLTERPDDYGKPTRFSIDMPRKIANSSCKFP